MDLGALVQQTVEVNDSVTFFELDNGFAIGCEVGEDGEKRYCLLNNLNDHSDIPYGDNARSIPDGGYSSFSDEAKKLLESHAANLENPLQPIDEQICEIYDQILEPIEIKPVRRPNFSIIALVAAVTATYPLAVAGVAAYLGIKSALRKDQHGDQYLLMGTLYAPFLLPGAVKDLVRPSVSGVRIKDSDVFESKPEGENYVGIGDSIGFNPRYFGDSSSVKGRKAFLDITFSDGLKLSESLAYYPKNGNHYDSSGFFLPFDIGLREQLDGLLGQEKAIYQSWRDFEKSVKPEDVAKLLE